VRENNKLVRRVVIAGVLSAAIVGAASWPVTTSVGYNYHVTTKRWTLFEKAVAFVDRDLEMRRLTSDIAGADGTQEKRLLRMYDWVTENIHTVPPDMPVVDDHVLNIFVRHYGAIDQRAEALAALASYDGMPSALVALGKNPKRRLVQLTVVQMRDRVVAFDVNNRVVFRKPSGELASLDDLVADPSIIRESSHGAIVDGAPYEEHFERLREISPNYLRMAQQRVLPRLVNELGSRLRLW
jgi:hypothetical protein